MKTIFTYYFIIVTSGCLFSQKEANWWHFGQKVAMNFSSGTPVYSFTSSIHSFESSATVSDSVGNLLFYTNGDTIWDKNNSIMPNGTQLMVLANQTNTIGTTSSTTQGAIIIKKPTLSNIYYVFSIGGSGDNYSGYLEYSIVDMNLNGNNGAVISKNNILLLDTLTEKMTATKHCNNKDIWLLIVLNENSKIGSSSNNECSFLSFLITDNGINPTPVKSFISLNTEIPIYGQIKFNLRGDMLAWANTNSIELFNFNKETGIVTHNRSISLDLNNGYGLEFSPDGNIIYINEKQYDLTTNTLTDLLYYDCPSQLQLANNGKIYKPHFPKAEINTSNNNIYISGSINNAFRITQIDQPNTTGFSCTFDTAFIYNYIGNYNNYFGIGLPNFQSYYFFHPKGEFSYSGYCSGNNYQFYLKNTPVVADSIKWFFYDNNQSSLGQTVTHVYSSSGSHQVSCIVYDNGIADTTTQCVTVCGNGNSYLPKNITLCYGTEESVNAVSPCGYKYKWSTGDTVSGITINKEGLYILETINLCGTYYDTINVQTVFCDPGYEIPNVFTPNDDGTNDLYNIKLKNIKSIEYYIYNRWGDLIKTKKEDVNIIDAWQYYTLWNGKKEDNEVFNDGTYFYIILLTDYKNTEIKNKGFFNLFKN